MGVSSTTIQNQKTMIVARESCQSAAIVEVHCEVTVMLAFQSLDSSSYLLLQNHSLYRAAGALTPKHPCGEVLWTFVADLATLICGVFVDIANEELCGFKNACQLCDELCHCNPVEGLAVAALV